MKQGKKKWHNYFELSPAMTSIGQFNVNERPVTFRSIKRLMAYVQPF